MNLFLKLSSILLAASYVSSETISCQAIVRHQTEPGIVPCSLRSYRRPYTNNNDQIIATKTQKGVVSGGTYNMDLINRQENTKTEDTVINIHIPVGLGGYQQTQVFNNDIYGSAPNIGFYPWSYPTPTVFGPPFVPKPDSYSSTSSQLISSSNNTVPVQTTSQVVISQGETETSQPSYTSIPPSNTIQNQTVLLNYSLIPTPTPILSTLPSQIPSSIQLPSVIPLNIQQPLTNTMNNISITSQNSSIQTPSPTLNTAPTPILSSNTQTSPQQSSLNTTISSSNTNNNRFVLGQGLNLSRFLNATDLAILGCDEFGNC